MLTLIKYEWKKTFSVRLVSILIILINSISAYFDTITWSNQGYYYLDIIHLALSVLLIVMVPIIYAYHLIEDLDQTAPIQQLSPHPSRYLVLSKILVIFLNLLVFTIIYHLTLLPTISINGQAENMLSILFSSFTGANILISLGNLLYPMMVVTIGYFAFVYTKAKKGRVKFIQATLISFLILVALGLLAGFLDKNIALIYKLSANEFINASQIHTDAIAFIYYPIISRAWESSPPFTETGLILNIGSLLLTLVTSIFFIYKTSKLIDKKVDF